MTSDARFLDELAVGSDDCMARREALTEARFRDLYQRTSRALWRYLARVSGSSGVADDLLQDTYLRILQARFEPESDAHMRNYLFRIATNLLRDRYRSLRSVRAALPQAITPERPGDRIHLKHDLKTALCELKPRERQLLWLVHVEGLSHREVAGMMGITEGSVRPLLYRARRRLAASLRERHLVPEGPA